MGTEENRLNEISKFLSYVLRHQPDAIGLQLDDQGWGDIDSLIIGANKQGHKINRSVIQTVVAINDKRRFTISNDGQRIRALQGHSTTDVRLRYPEKEPPEHLYHGTATRFLHSIREEGIKPGARHHVHLSQDRQTAIAVGKRYGAPSTLKIEALRMHQQGFKFFLAENGVWLADYIPPSFIVE
ncbi:RNA 2'-phosphotransferase [Trinickia fusca]|uniref:Probable RNA 2'-phosphotransferase n=1 Tax=Trinickia fusca TaxID=2419777 RepID=A0A494WZ09_9BURK|nr:RNA 2'-phosphotransferase [Trinickia fusca]RKP43272.1 RNA 2'-phosphotransferase [Trinickia fusca]